MNLTKSKMIAMHNNRSNLSTERIRYLQSVMLTGNSNLYLVDSVASELGYKLSDFIALGYDEDE